MWSGHRPSQGQASNRKGKPAPALAGRNGNLTMEMPIRLLGPQLSRLPPPVFFLSAQCAPRADNTVGLVGVYLACPLGSQGAQVPAYLGSYLTYLLYQRRSRHGQVPACVRVCVRVCARWPPAASSLERRE